MLRRKVCDASVAVAVELTAKAREGSDSQESGKRFAAPVERIDLALTSSLQAKIAL